MSPREAGGSHVSPVLHAGKRGYVSRGFSGGRRIPFEADPAESSSGLLLGSAEAVAFLPSTGFKSKNKTSVSASVCTLSARIPVLLSTAIAVTLVMSPGSENFDDRPVEIRDR